MTGFDGALEAPEPDAIEIGWLSLAGPGCIRGQACTGAGLLGE
jgi:hypothetical protein